MGKLITIQHEDGAKQVDAKVYGRFAVHGSELLYTRTNKIYVSEVWFCVTHVETGLSIIRMIDGFRPALALAKRMNEVLTEDVIQRIHAKEETAIATFVKAIKDWYADFGATYDV